MPPVGSAAAMYDIARVAGVNPSTVSRDLNKPGRVSVKTEERIHAAAKALSYRLNPMALALPTGRRGREHDGAPGQGVGRSQPSFLRCSSAGASSVAMSDQVHSIETLLV